MPSPIAVRGVSADPGFDPVGEVLACLPLCHGLTITAGYGTGQRGGTTV